MILLKREDIIRDPIYGYIEWTKLEEKIINSPYFQRLRFIKQTPGASFVYSGASHTRFEHSLGVMHLAGILSEQILLKSELLKEKKESIKSTEICYIDKEDIDNLRRINQLIRLSALLHDIAHGPFSHLFEYNFKDSLYTLEDKEFAYNHEQFAELIIKNHFSEIIRSADFNRDDVDLIIKIINEKKEQIELLNNGLNDQFLFQIIATKDSIDLDKCDYLLRDAFHTGTIEYGHIDVNRILLNCVIIKDEERKANVLAFNTRILNCILSILTARYNMYLNVYFHRTSRAIENLISDILALSNKEFKFTSIIEDEDLNEFLNLNDSILWEIKKNSKNTDVQDLFNRLLKREQYRPAYIGHEIIKDNTKVKYIREDLVEKKQDKINKIIGDSDLTKQDFIYDVPEMKIPWNITNSWYEILSWYEIENEKVLISEIDPNQKSLLQDAGGTHFLLYIFSRDESKKELIKEQAEKVFKTEREDTRHI